MQILRTSRVLLSPIFPYDRRLPTHYPKNSKKQKLKSYSVEIESPGINKKTLSLEAYSIATCLHSAIRKALPRNSRESKIAERLDITVRRLYDIHPNPMHLDSEIEKLLRIR